MAEIDREELKSKLMEKIAFGTIHLEHSNVVQKKLSEVMRLIDSYAAEKEKAAELHGRLNEHKVISDIMTNKDIGSIDPMTIRRLKSRQAELQNEREGNAS